MLLAKSDCLHPMLRQQVRAPLELTVHNYSAHFVPTRATPRPTMSLSFQVCQVCSITVHLFSIRSPIAVNSHPTVHLIPSILCICWEFEHQANFLRDTDMSPQVKEIAECECLTLEQLAEHFDKPIRRAAKDLEISLTQLKKVCRIRGIPRWPQRKVCVILQKECLSSILTHWTVKQFEKQHYNC